VGKICDFWPITRCISVITNRKSYTGFRLAPKSMTLNAKIWGFMDFSPILGCDTGLYHTVNASLHYFVKVTGAVVSIPQIWSPNRVQLPQFWAQVPPVSDSFFPSILGFPL